MDLSGKLIDWLSSVTGDNTAIIIIASVVLLILGFLALIKGADIFVEGASKVAEKMKVPLIVIGLTVVAFGTSAPEAAISITSSATGNMGVAIGNIVGSNIMNIMLILGLSAIFAPLFVKKNTFRFEMPIVIGITVLLLVLGIIGNSIDFIDGIILLVAFIGFMTYNIWLSKHGEADDDIKPTLTAKDTVPKMIFMILIGLVAIVLGSDMTVEGASQIASAIGVSDRVIGLTIVAFGTSLPELVTSVTAARRGKTDIAIGNIIGSNIFNILFVVGIASLINPLSFETAFIPDTIIAILAALLLFFLVLRTKTLRKTGGIIMLSLYAIYFGYICVSQINAI